MKNLEKYRILENTNLGKYKIFENTKSWNIQNLEKTISYTMLFSGKTIISLSKINLERFCNRGEEYFFPTKNWWQ
jgi:hypothetical protein